MSTITGTATEPQTTLTAPTVGGDTDSWGTTLNGTTLQALLNYALWLKARVPATDPSAEVDGRTLVVAAGALVFGDAAAAAVAWGGITGTLGDQTDLQAALDGKATAAQGATADTAVQPGDPVLINAQTGTAYTLVLTDAGKLVTLSNASATALTVPTNAAVAFPVGTVIALAQVGAGTVSVAGDTGVTVHSLTASVALAGQYATASLVKLAADEWLLSGALT